MTRPTEKQQAQRSRSWRIFQLRGLYAQLFTIRNPKRRAIMQALVDDELADLHAEPETARQVRMRREWDRETADPIPF